MRPHQGAPDGHSLHCGPGLPRQPSGSLFTTHSIFVSGSTRSCLRFRIWIQAFVVSSLTTDALEGGEVPPFPLQGAQPATASLTPKKMPASMAFVTHSNRPQPLWQPPPIACLTASGAASRFSCRLMHPWPPESMHGRRIHPLWTFPGSFLKETTTFCTQTGSHLHPNHILQPKTSPSPSRLCNSRFPDPSKQNSAFLGLFVVMVHQYSPAPAPKNPISAYQSVKATT